MNNCIEKACEEVGIKPILPLWQKVCLFLTFFYLFFFCISSYGQDKFPQRIVSLAPSITEELYLLGVQDMLVANTIYCNKPENAKKKEKVGNVIEANIEKIISLKPDLVLASTLINPKTKEKLENLKIRVITLSPPKSFVEICEQFIELGRILGKEHKAEEIVYRAKKDISSIKKRINKLSNPKVLVQVGTKPLWVAPKDSFVNDIIKIAGGINVGPSGENGLYSREEVLKQNPDIIIITTMGIVGLEEKKLWQKYRTINAVKNNRIYIVDSDKLCSPTPLSFVKILEEIVKILHPSENNHY